MHAIHALPQTVHHSHHKAAKEMWDAMRALAEITSSCSSESARRSLERTRASAVHVLVEWSLQLRPLPLAADEGYKDCRGAQRACNKCSECKFRATARCIAAVSSGADREASGASDEFRDELHHALGELFKHRGDDDDRVQEISKQSSAM